MNFSKNNITTYSSCWDIYPTQIEAEPIITMLAIIVYTNTIPINPDTPIVVEVFFKNLQIR